MNKKNNFIEYMAFFIAFVLLVFCGVAIFVTPQNKIEYKFDKVNISDDMNKKENVNLNDETLSIEDINKKINERENKFHKYQNAYSSYIKRKKIDEILKSRETTKEKNINKPTSVVSNHIEQTMPLTELSQKQEEEISKFENHSDCRTSEIEYILNLYDKSLKKQFSLVFRRDEYVENGKPNIVDATLPYNTWTDVGNDFSAAMSAMYDSLFSGDSDEDNEKSKVSAIITTPCSKSIYSSNSFYVDLKTPVSYNYSSNSNYCQSKGGRLPDVLELVSVIKNKQNLPSGYYLSSSKLVNKNKITNENIILKLSENSMTIHSSSNIGNGAKIFYQCVFDKK